MCCAVVVSVWSDGKGSRETRNAQGVGRGDKKACMICKRFAKFRLRLNVTRILNVTRNAQGVGGGDKKSLQDLQTFYKNSPAPKKLTACARGTAVGPN